MPIFTCETVDRLSVSGERKAHFGTGGDCLCWRSLPMGWWMEVNSFTRNFYMFVNCTGSAALVVPVRFDLFFSSSVCATVGDGSSWDNIRVQVSSTSTSHTPHHTSHTPHPLFQFKRTFLTIMSEKAITFAASWLLVPEIWNECHKQFCGNITGN